MHVIFHQKYTTQAQIMMASNYHCFKEVVQMQHEMEQIVWIHVKNIYLCCRMWNMHFIVYLHYACEHVVFLSDPICILWILTQFIKACIHHVIFNACIFDKSTKNKLTWNHGKLNFHWERSIVSLQIGKSMSW